MVFIKLESSDIMLLPLPLLGASGAAGMYEDERWDNDRNFASLTIRNRQPQ